MVMMSRFVRRWGASQLVPIPRSGPSSPDNMHPSHERDDFNDSDDDPDYIPPADGGYLEFEQ